MLDNIIKRQVLVSGRVQGVFFRDSCAQLAKQLELSGGVRNLHDGRVEVLVFGGETAVEVLIKWLKIGPKHAKVSIIEVVDIPVSGGDEKIATAESSAANLIRVEQGRFVVWATR